MRVSSLKRCKDFINLGTPELRKDNVPELLVSLPEGMGGHEGTDMGRDGVGGPAWAVLRTA